MTDTDSLAGPSGEPAVEPGRGAGLEAGSEPGPEPEPRLGRAGILLGVVSGVALAGIAGTIAFGVMWGKDRSAASDQAAAHDLASRFLLDLTNFGPKNINKDFTEMQAMATGGFARQVRQTLAPQLRGQLVAADVQTQGQITHLWVQSYSGEAASYYAEVTQTFRNNRTPAVRSDVLRVEVDLSKVGGQWKVGQVTTIGSTTPTTAAPGGASGGG